MLNNENKSPRFICDKYVVVDGKFVHTTPEYYNPYFDGKTDSKGHKRTNKEMNADERWKW